MVVITRRNTRRYGGYIVHFGIMLIIIGFAGLPFNQDKEQEMGFGDKMEIAGYTLVCQSYTQDDKPNYCSEWAVMDVYKQRQADRHHVSRTALLQGKRADSDHRGQPLAAERRLVPGLHRAKSGHGQADHQGPRQSAGDVDLDWRESWCCWEP